MGLADQPRRAHAVHRRHLHVHQHQIVGPAIGVARVHLVHADLAVLGDLDLEARVAQHLGGDLLVDLVVLHQQDACAQQRRELRLQHAAAGLALGRRGLARRVADELHHGVDQQRRADRLGQHMLDAFLARACQQLLAAMRGDHQHQRHGLRPHRLDGADRLEAVHAGHDPVHQQEVVGRAAHVGIEHARHGGATRVDALGREAELRQQLAQHQRDGLVVVDHQHAAAVQLDAGAHDELVGRADAQARREPERAALPVHAVHADVAAHGLCQVLADRQAEAGAAVLARGRLVCLLEAREQAAGLLGRQPDAAVGDGEPQQRLGVAGLLDAHLDAHLAVLGELDGVAGVVDQDLADAQRIADEHARQLGVHHPQQLEALGVGLLGQHVDDVVQHRFQLERQRVDLQLARLDLREVEDVVDDAQQVLAAALDLDEIVVHARRHVVLHGQPRQSDDRVHRRADLVAHVGQELALDATDRLGRGARLAQLACLQRVVERDRAEGRQRAEDQPLALVVGERRARLDRQHAQQLVAHHQRAEQAGGRRRDVGQRHHLQVATGAVVQELLALPRRAGRDRFRIIERDAHRRPRAARAVVDAERLDETVLLGVERVDQQQVGRDQRADVRRERLEHAIGIEVARDLLADQAQPVQRRDGLLENAHASGFGGGQLLLQLMPALRGLGLMARLHRLHRLRGVARVLVLDRRLGLALEGQRPRQVAGLLPGARRLRQVPRARQAALRHGGELGQQRDVVQRGRRREQDGRARQRRLQVQLDQRLQRVASGVVSRRLFVGAQRQPVRALEVAPCSEAVCLTDHRARQQHVEPAGRRALVRGTKDLQRAVDVARGQARLAEMDLRDHRVERRRDRRQVDAGAFQQLQPRALVAEHVVVARQGGERVRDVGRPALLARGRERGLAQRDRGEDVVEALVGDGAIERQVQVQAQQPHGLGALHVGAQVRDDFREMSRVELHRAARDRCVELGAAQRDLGPRREP